jgi:hypothetical protein
LHRRFLAEIDELRMRVRQARSGRLAFIDPGEEDEAVLASCPRARSPGLCDEAELRGVEIGDRADVIRRVDDDLLAVEGRELVRDDPDRPAGCVGRPVLGQGEDLRRGLILASLAERARFALFRGLLVETRPRGSGPAGPSRRDGDEASRERVLPQIGQEPEFVRSRKGFSRSSGAGKTIVVEAEEPSSSRVCR